MNHESEALFVGISLHSVRSGSVM